VVVELCAGGAGATSVVVVLDVMSFESLDIVALWL